MLTYMAMVIVWFRVFLAKAREFRHKNFLSFYIWFLSLGNSNTRLKIITKMLKAMKN